MSDKKTPIPTSPTAGFRGRVDAMARTVDNLTKALHGMDIGGEAKSDMGIAGTPSGNPVAANGKKKGVMNARLKLSKTDLSVTMTLAAGASGGGSPSTQDSGDMSLQDESSPKTTRHKRKLSGNGKSRNLGQPAVW